MACTDAVREGLSDQDRDVLGTDFCAPVGVVAVGVEDVVGVRDPSVLLLLVVVVGYVGIELIAVGSVASEEAIACVLATAIGIEALGIAVVEVRPEVDLPPHVHTEVPRYDVLTLVGLEVALIAYEGERRLRVVEAYLLGGVKHTIVAVGVEEVPHTTRSVEEELRLPDVVHIPLIGRP